MSNYFSYKSWVSNSFLKTIAGAEYPANIDRIFEFGSLAHACIFEPHLANKNDVDYELALKMRDTFHKDWLCSSIMKYPDIKCEHEFYRRVDGLQRRCKADATIKSMGLIVEFKGLSVTSEKQFQESIGHFDYDMGAAWYIDTTGMNRELIVGVSKKKPEKIFRFMVEKGDEVYTRGREKYIQAITKGLLTGQISNESISDPEKLQNLIDEPCYSQIS